jgi:hypothetical protein
MVKKFSTQKAVGFYISHNNHITELLLVFLHAEKRSHRPSWFAILDKRTHTPSHIPEIFAFLKVDGREECSVEVLNPRKSCCFILHKCALVSYIHLLCHRLCRHHGRVSHFGVVPEFFHGVLIDIFCVCFAEAHNSMESDSNCFEHQGLSCIFRCFGGVEGRQKTNIRGGMAVFEKRTCLIECVYRIFW